MIQGKDLISEYAYILRDYLQEGGEASLKCLSEFVRKLVEIDITPEAILAVHFEVVRGMMKELPTVVRPPFIALSLECLSEILTDYHLAVTERIKSKKVEYDRIREHIYLLEKRSKEPDPHGEKRQRTSQQSWRVREGNIHHQYYYYFRTGEKLSQVGLLLRQQMKNTILKQRNIGRESR